MKLRYLLLSVSILPTILLVPFVAASAQTPFDGTWKMDVNSIEFPQKPDAMVIQNGMFHCQTCVPPIEIKADGQWQKVSGNPDFDMMMITVVDDKHLERATQKEGKLVTSGKATLSDDGKTMTAEWINKSSSGGPDSTGQTTMIRVADGPAGSHPFSGSWRSERMESASTDAMRFVYKSTEVGMDYSSSEGESYSAKFNGGDVPVKGVPDNIVVSIKKLGTNVLEESYKRDGRPFSVTKITVIGDKMSVEYTDHRDGTTTKFRAVKQ